MSQRSIIEINHDYFHEIDDHPKEFVFALLAALSWSDHSLEEKLKRFGIRRVIQRHHTDAAKVVIGDREYEIG